MNHKKVGRFYGIGVGPGDPELVTLKAGRVLSQVPVIFVPKKRDDSASFARSIISGFIGDGQEVVELVFPMVRDPEERSRQQRRAVDNIWNRLEQGEDCAMVCLGDPLLYGTFVHVLEIMRQEHPGLQIETVPGVSSISAAAARALIPLGVEDDRIAVISGRCDDGFVTETLRRFDTVVFIKVYAVFDWLLGILEELDLVRNSVFVEKCSTAEERVITDIRQLKGSKLDYFSLLIVRK